MAEKADSIDRIGVLPDVYRNVPEYVPYSINKINRQTANKHGTLSRAGAERAVPGFFLPSFPVMRPGVCVWCFDGFAAAALDLAERKLLSDGRINQAGERERERERGQRRAHFTVGPLVIGHGRVQSHGPAASDCFQMAIGYLVIADQ